MSKKQIPTQSIPTEPTEPTEQNLNPDGTTMPTWTLMCIICLKPTIEVQIINAGVRTICIECCKHIRKTILRDTDDNKIQYITPRPILPNK